MADLSTDTKKVEEYNKEIGEAKKDSKIDASEVAFNIALSAARSEVFPPFGLISFKPDQATDDKSMKSLVDQTIKGAQNFYNGKFASAGAEHLIYEDVITSNPVFKQSKAVTELEAKTKSDFKEIKSVIDSKKDDPNEKTGDKPVDKLSESSLTSILASTMVDFLKEIGVKRENAEAGDKYNKETGGEALKQLETASKPAAAPAPASPAAPAAATVAPAISPIAEAKTSSETNQLKEPIAGNASPITAPAAPQSLPTTKPPVSVSNTQTNVTNTGGATTTNTNNVSVKSETTQIATAATPAQPAALPAAATTPAATPAPAGGEEIEGGPISSALFSALGMSAEEGQAIFKGGNPANIESAISQTFSPSAAVTSTAPTAIQSAAASAQNAVATARTETKAITEAAKPAEAAKIVKGEATKITNQAVPKMEQPKPPTEEAKAEPAAEQEAPSTTGNAPSSENKQEPASETKNESSSKNEESENVNSQLLNVMEEILKTLRGPLIFSEDRPRFI